MFSNRSTISRGCSLAAATLAAVACIGLASTASASTVIYQDSFNGTGALNGAAPTIDNGSSTTWTATLNGTNSSFYHNGSASETSAAGALGYLNFTPATGNIYTLSATLSLPASSADTISGETNWNWFAVGYTTSVNTSSGATFNSGSSPNPYAWVIVYAPVDNNGLAGEGFEGPNSSTPAQAFSTPSGQSDTAQQISIVLNTGASTWTYQFFDDGTAVSSVESFSSNPPITGVGLCLQGSPNWSSPVTGTVSNFSLTSSPVPEPATLGLVAVGGLGLSLLKRRKTI
ncbi:MAG: PEP-CTERM sorting domain-containing protein [Planctomycetia bacterium]|nr:PEP-CTERM sorting domain-containing protein [Planctomycetia bacterium]